MAQKKSKATENISIDDTSTEDILAVTAQAEPAKSSIPVAAPVATRSPNELVNVKNGFQGTLVYVSKRTGERFIWDSFGDEQEMELSELKSAKNSCKDFFISNWFLFDDPDIIDYLGVRQYYKNALDINALDTLFQRPADEVREIVTKLSTGQKETVAFRAKQMMAEGAIDSLKVISVLEEALGVELIER